MYINLRGRIAGKSIARRGARGCEWTPPTERAAFGFATGGYRNHFSPLANICICREIVKSNAIFRIVYVLVSGYKVLRNVVPFIYLISLEGLETHSTSPP